MKEVALKVREIMTREPKVATPETTLAAAGALMLDGGCGMLPVIDGAGKLVGVVTDREEYIALATRDKRVSEVRVGEVMRQPVWTCGPDDDVEAALATIRPHRVRRLPVEGFGGSVLGVLSLNDIVLASGPFTPVHEIDVVALPQAIWSHHHAKPHIVAV